MRAFLNQPFSELQQYLATHHHDMGCPAERAGGLGWPLPRAVLEEILPRGYRLLSGKPRAE